MATGPTWEDRYMNDPEFARRWDREMDKADKEFEEYLDAHPWKKAKFTITFVPIMLVVFVIASIATPFETISYRLRNRKSR